MPEPTRWQLETGGEYGEDYHAALAERHAATLAEGGTPHGEADLVAALAPHGASVLDAGCGTGRVGVELVRRGFAVLGVDADASCLTVARREHPELEVRQVDLTTLHLDRTFDLVLLAGNVLVFLAPGTESQVVERVLDHVGRGGVVVAGFRLGDEGVPTLDEFDALFRTRGFVVRARHDGWDGAAFTGGDYAVSVWARGDDLVDGAPSGRRVGGG